MIFNLRTAIPQDLDLTYKIKKNVLLEYLELLWGWNEEAQYEFHQEHFNPNNFQIIEFAQTSIGYLETELHTDYLFIYNIMILKPYQQRGIGKMILEDLIKNNTKIELEVLKVNARAILFYQNLAFTIFAEKEDVFCMRFEK
ncbi:MAG: GNAT family N-acetyltransferase [Arcicella sp.]|nr:GNAT family N-acetyltransferase [Arcicella sp.]